jgi:hypothetical protein
MKNKIKNDKHPLFILVSRKSETIIMNPVNPYNLFNLVQKFSDW